MGTGFSRGKEQPGRDADPSPPSSAVRQERVELYLYSLYGPYDMYRVSVPVQGCTVPFTFFISFPKLIFKNKIFLSKYYFQ